MAALPSHADVLIVGGGITGLSTAVHAARHGLSTVLVDAAPTLGGVSTQRSGALVRTHYEDPASALLALRGLELFESFEQRYGGSSGFRATGFAYVPEAEELASGAFEQRVVALRALGVETEILEEAGLAAIDPSISIADAGVAAYEPRSGFADPAATTATLTAAALDAGATLMPATQVTDLLSNADGSIAGVRLAGATGEALVAAGDVVLCAGAWSPQPAAQVGVDLPIRATAVKLAFVTRAVADHLTVIDAPNGIYLRPDPDGATLVGRRTWTDEPLDGPDAPLPDVDDAFLTEALERVAKRIPSAAGATVAGTRAGMLDMTPDGLPLVGPALRDGAAVPGLWLCCGWSGTGFKTGPAVGEALADWIATGACALDLSSLDPARDFSAASEPVRSPH